MTKRLSALLFVCALLIAGREATAQSKPATEYICPMYCTDEVSHEPGKCSVCGMSLQDRAIVENPKDHKILFPKEVYKRIQSDPDILLLDVRSQAEYNDDLGHLENSILIPVRELEQRIDELAPYKDKTIITYCSHGIRSARAAKLLQKNGYEVYSLIGGLTKWNREKLPVVRE